MLCSSCATVLDPASQFCTRCGTRQPAAEMPYEEPPDDWAEAPPEGSPSGSAADALASLLAAPSQPVAEPSGADTCAACEARIPEQASFCTRCGTPRGATPPAPEGLHATLLPAAPPAVPAPALPPPMRPAPGRTAAMPPPRPAHVARPMAAAPVGGPGLHPRLHLRRIYFHGQFSEYFIASIGLVVLCFCTLGFAIPFALYWQARYYFTHLTVDGQQVVFTGNFADYYFKSLGLAILTLFTFGFAYPYFLYWSVKYFFDHMDLAPARGESFAPGSR